MRNKVLRGRRVSRVPGFGLERLEMRLVLSADVWTGAGTGDWSDATDWSPAEVPVAGDTLTFPSGLTGSALTSNNDLTAGTSFAGITVAGSGYAIGGNAIALTGTLSGSQTSGSSTVSLPIGFGSSAGAVDVAVSGATLVLSGVISGTAGLTTTGPGTIELSATNTYTGTTTAVAGTLQVDGTVLNGVAVSSQASLIGTGTVGAIRSTSGIVSAGDSAPGILNDTGGLTLDAGSSFNATLNGDTAGTTYGQVKVGGVTNLASATLNLTVGYTPTAGDQYTIIDNTGDAAVTGTFAGLAQGATVTAGGQQFTISYTGGTNGDSVVLTHLITTATVLAASPTSAVYGQPVTLTATVTSGTGTAAGSVEFLSGTTELGTSTLNSSGVASFSTTGLPTAADSVTAVYQGSTTYATSTSSPTTVTVSQALTTTKLTSTPNPSTSGASVTLTATVLATSPGAGSPTGSVEFMNGSTSLGTGTLSSGSASIAVTSLPLGANSITAVYQGDTNFTTSTSNTVSQTVDLGSTTSLVSSSASTVYGQIVTFTATVAASGSSSGTPTGTVSFTSGTIALGTANVNSSGVAALSTNILPTDSGSTPNSITATYSGDSTYGTSTSTAVTVAVSQASTTTVLTTSPNPSTGGAQVTLTATMTPVSPGTGTPTGSVTFDNGSTSLGTATVSDGVATLTVTSLAIGSNSITAVYGGDTNYLTSTSPAVTQVVNEATSTTTLSVSSTNPFAYQSVTLSVTVAATGTESGTPTGTVTFTTGTGTVLGTATLAAGAGALTLTTLPVGSDTITATYGGDSNFTGSNSLGVVVSVGTANEMYINQVFVQLTGQVADGGLVYWTDTLDAGYSREFVVNNILKSAQANAYAVNSAYQRFLGRDATLVETNSALSGSGASINKLDATILGSDEFYTTKGHKTTSGYLSALAQAWLGEGFTKNQTAHYTEQLKQGVSRYRIAEEVIKSAGGRVAEVSDYFVQILGRTASTKELKTYSSLLAKTGNVSLLIDALLASDEFYDDNSQI